MGSHITTDTKSIKTYQLNLKSKVVAAILNYIMKIFAISSLIFLIVAIEIIGKATGCPQFWDWAGIIDNCRGSNAGEACCKEHGINGFPEECLSECQYNTCQIC